MGLALLLGGSGPVSLLATQGFAGRAAVLTGICVAWGILLQWASRGSGVRPAALLVAAIIVPTLTHPTMGRAPAAVALIGIAIAWIALGASAPLAFRSTRPRAVATLAVPWLVSAEVLWVRRQSITITTALMIVSVGVVAIYELAPRLMERIDARTKYLVRIVADTVGLACLAIVAFPLLYLPGALTNMFSRRPRRARWHEVNTPLNELLRDAERPFLTEPRHARRRRVATGAIVLAVAATISAIAILDPPQIQPRQATPLPTADSGAPRLFALESETLYSRMPAYRNTPWADDLQVEQSLRGDKPNFQGHYLNVRDGFRVTRRPPACSCDPVTIWFSGGSAAYGEGQRDDHTIASQLVSLAAADGLSVDVRNIAHDGWTMTLEAGQAEGLLHNDPPPDMIIFYNGWNDVISALSSAFVHGLEHTEIRFMDFSNIEAINADWREFSKMRAAPAVGRIVAENYQRLQHQVDSVASDAGVETYYFFQSDALVDSHQLAGYEELSNISAEELLGSPFAQALRVTTEGLQNSVRDLRPLFVGVQEPLFMGLVHQNERGAGMVAAEIYRQILPGLREAARGR